jgi:hypothetical protein
VHLLISAFPGCMLEYKKLWSQRAISSSFSFFYIKLKGIWIPNKTIPCNAGQLSVSTAWIFPQTASI